MLNCLCHKAGLVLASFPKMLAGLLEKGGELRAAKVLFLPMERFGKAASLSWSVARATSRLFWCITSWVWILGVFLGVG